MGTLQESRETTQAQTAERRGRNVRKERREDMYDIIKIQIKNKIQISKIIVRARVERWTQDRTAAMHTCICIHAKSRWNKIKIIYQFEI